MSTTKEDDDEAMARRVEEEEREAARAMGTNREAIRNRHEMEARDAELARRLQEEEAREAASEAGTNLFGGLVASMFGAALDDFAAASERRWRGAEALFADEDETTHAEGEGEDERETVGRASGSAGGHREFSDMMRNFEGVVEGMMGGNVPFGGRGNEGRQRERGEPAEGRPRTAFEIPIGRNGETLVLNPDEIFGGMDEFFGRHGMPGSIMDMLNSLSGMNFAGNNNRGTTEEQRDAIPVCKYSRAPGDAENATCSVCLTELEEGEDVKILPCKHIYHPQCIDRWLERSKLCCVCKADVLRSPETRRPGCS